MTFEEYCKAVLTEEEYATLETMTKEHDPDMEMLKMEAEPDAYCFHQLVQFVSSYQLCCKGSVLGKQESGFFEKFYNRPYMRGIKLKGTRKEPAWEDVVDLLLGGYY